MIEYPTGPEPVNEMIGSRSSATRPGIDSFGTGSTDHMPAGRSVSASSSPRSSAVSGVAGAGLTMIGAPTAIAGATLCATRFSGKLNGAMPRTGPLGKRRTRAARPAIAVSVSSRISSPPSRRTSSAAQRKVAAPRVASARAHLIGLPFSAVISVAISSSRSVIRRDTCIRASARVPTESLAAVRRMPSAAATASSTCAAVGTETLATSEPSYGWVTSRMPEPVVARPAR